MFLDTFDKTYQVDFLPEIWVATVLITTQFLTLRLFGGGRVDIYKLIKEGHA